VIGELIVRIGSFKKRHIGLHFSSSSLGIGPDKPSISNNSQIGVLTAL
jgi:hypothetical protein